MTGVVQGAGHLAGVGPLGLSYRFFRLELDSFSRGSDLLVMRLHYRLEDIRALSETTVNSHLGHRAEG